MIGQKLGKYLIEGELGRGGMGVVYRGYQTSLERTVAIKVLTPSLTNDPDGVARFKREAKAIARLNHHNIVQVFDIEDEGTLTFLVMEFIEGEGLDHLLSRMALPERRILRIVADIAEGLGFAHGKGVVHRDIKPANILITKEGRVKVADFGLAHFLDQGGQTKTGILIGSPSYMSPEQVQGIKVDGRTDIYSLGVVLFRMLCGRVPFEAESSHALLYKQVQERPPDPRELNPALSVELRNVVLKSLEKNPANRYQTMGEFRKALLKCMGPDEEAAADSEGTGVMSFESEAPAEDAFDETAPTRQMAARKSAAAAAAAAAVSPHSPTSISASPADVPAAAEGTRKTAVMTEEPTERVAKPAREEARLAPVPSPPPAPEPRRPAWIVPAAVVAVLVVAFLGYKALGPKVGPDIPDITPVPTGVPLPSPVAQATPAAAETPALAPTSLPTQVAEVTPVPRVERPTPVVIASLPTRAPAQVEPRPTIAIAPPSTAVVKPGSFICLGQPDPTSFAQGVTKGVAEGFAADDGAVRKAARFDAAEFEIRFKLDPDRPAAGREFNIVGQLHNRAEDELDIVAIEEQGPDGRWKSVSNPNTGLVDPGKIHLIYAATITLDGTQVWSREIRVTDHKGDSWRRKFFLRPCG